jgi:virulence-associated protein VapD
MAEQKRFKALNFDLDTHHLIEVFGEAGRRNAYAQIKSFMLRNDFSHRQWSGYVSNNRKTYLEIYAMIDELLIKHPWLARCTNRFDITDFMAQSDALDYIVMTQENTAVLNFDVSEV